MFGDAAQVASGRYGDLPSIGTPMYEYTLNEDGMPILGKLLSNRPESDIEDGRRIITVGSTGPDPMPNGQGFVFGAVWGDPTREGETDSDFRPDTIVYDTRGNAPFPAVATIRGLRMITSLPYGDNQLLISGVSDIGNKARRKLFLTPRQSAPGDWSFLNQEQWTQLPGEIEVNGDPPADIASSLFRVETPTGTQYGLLTPNENSSGIDLRLSATPQTLLKATKQSIVPDGRFPDIFLYAPNVTKAVALSDDTYDLAITFSARKIPKNVKGPELGKQIYENVFGHVIISPPR